VTPSSFDHITAREITGDAEARNLEAAARSDADAHRFAPPPVTGSTYWDQVTAQMRHIVYTTQHAKRAARNARKAAARNA
jgi:hypothetical protein